MIKIPEGALTALITPFDSNGVVDWHGFNRLIRFQVSQGISGIVPVGTTGESPTLTEAEHCSAIFNASASKNDLFVLPGCGSNCTREAMYYVSRASDAQAKAVLLVDPYYNGPSSLEIKKEYYEPIAKTFPDISIVPYIIPGRTGCGLLPEDLAALNREFPNICAVKEATGDLKRMALTRSLASPGFQIFSGDDDKTCGIMLMPEINACGVISVISNIAPVAVQRMCQLILQKDFEGAEVIRAKLRPLFGMVTVLSERIVGSTTVNDKFRNPLPIKTAMNGLGMPAGPCRQPLGKMSLTGVQKVRGTLFSVWTQNPEVLKPIEDFFGVDISRQLANGKLWASLSY